MSSNMLTQKSNLTFNVMRFKKSLIETCKVISTNNYKCSKAHVYLTKLNELLCYKLIENVNKNVEKDKNGLYTITRAMIKTSIETNDMLKRCFSNYLFQYDETHIYESQYPIAKKIIINFIEIKFGSMINFTPQAFDFLIYILIKATQNVIAISIELLNYADKRSINYKTISAAVQIELRNSEELREFILKQLHETYLLIGNTKDINNTNDSDDDDNKDNNVNDNNANDSDNNDNDNNDNNNANETDDKQNNNLVDNEIDLDENTQTKKQKKQKK